MKILIVEDERAIADLMILNLTRAGYTCTYAQDGEIAADLVEQHSFDLILLDIMLPKVDGYEFMSYVEPLKIPVIFITAKGSVKDKVKGLHMGADDYLVKPFAFEELSARIRVMLRKPEKEKSSVCSVADLHVHLDTRRVFRGEKEITLSSREFAVLRYLIQNAGIVLSREKLEQHIWNYDYAGGSNVIDVYIRYLRKKIDEGFEPKLIHTVRGAGYVLREPI